jgi:stearoyl-CoA desaturase (delta-9 desaturase)
MFDREPIRYRFRQIAPDLFDDPLVMWACRRYLLLAAVGLLIPMAIGGFATASWVGAWTGLLWGGFVRICLVHQLTWGINSFTHMFGRAPYDSGDGSTNLMPLALLNFGDGWHNNHHAFPTSARHGLTWWQLDLGYVVILAMKWLGLAWDVRTPNSAQLERKRKTADGLSPREHVTSDSSVS